MSLTAVHLRIITYTYQSSFWCCYLTWWPLLVFFFRQSTELLWSSQCFSSALFMCARPRAHTHTAFRDGSLAVRMSRMGVPSLCFILASGSLSPGKQPWLSSVRTSWAVSQQRWKNRNVLFSSQRLPSSESTLALIKNADCGNSLVVQWLGLSTFTALGQGLTPGRGTKIPQAQRQGQKTKTNKKCRLMDQKTDPLNQNCWWWDLGKRSYHKYCGFFWCTLNCENHCPTICH